MITFCDRTQVPETQTSDYTSKALSELQSYIESLPNTNRKRKLIKKVCIYHIILTWFQQIFQFKLCNASGAYGLKLCLQMMLKITLLNLYIYNLFTLDKTKPSENTIKFWYT